MNSSDRDIRLLCDIQNLLNHIGFISRFNLPTIIVVGSQSSGKSSVLEHIAGKDFLPRGQGIVTRRPVIIQKLVDPSISQDYAVLTENPNQRITNFEQVRTYLQDKMNQAASSEQGISPDPVVVKIFVKEGVNISMIDMPGLTKIALQDQNQNMPALIEDINRTYIQNPNSILLAISPANVDVANSDALRLAKEVDPQGTRTIGVFTKTDLIEDPNTIRKAFEGKAYPLKLGYYGVVCRSQNDINARLSIPQALQKEANYFKGSPHFQDYRDYCGISNLLFKLNRSLLEKIKETLPFIKETLKIQVSQKEESYQNFKRINDLVNTNEYSAILLNLVNTFKNNLTSALRGGSSNVKIKDKLFGGAKITLIFENEFHKKLFGIKIFDKIKDDEIYWTIKNSSGLQQAVFFNNEAFEELAKKQVVELKPPSMECLASVNEEIKNICKDILQEMKELQMFDRVGREIFSAVEDLMVKYYNDAKHAIELYFKVQAGCINQKHPGFVQNRNGVLEGSLKFVDAENRKSQGGFMDMFKKDSNKPISEGNKDVALMKNLLIAYNNLLKHDSYDYIQKVIVSLFINEMLASADQDLLSSVLRKGKAEVLCSVDRNKKDSFEKTENELRGLKQTLALLENVN